MGAAGEEGLKQRSRRRMRGSMITAPHPDDAAARPENGQSGIQTIKVKRHLRSSVFAGGHFSGYNDQKFSLTGR